MDDIKESGNGDSEALKKHNEETIAKNINNFKEFVNNKTVLIVRFNNETNAPEWLTTMAPHNLNFLLDSIKLNLLLPKPPKIVKPAPNVLMNLKNKTIGAFGKRF